ncbi:MAG: hypothetical protein NC124_13140 [Clostridium sp.]|nr:hypothetical protein [Clostridium sp.]
MKRFKWTKGISTALVAMGLAVTLAVPASAAKVDMQMSQQEVTQLGAPFATTLLSTTANGQHNVYWTFQTSAVVPEKGSLKYDLYRSDEGSNPYNLRTYDRYDANGNETEQTYFWSDYTLIGSGENEGNVYPSDGPGTYTLQLYYFDGAAYEAAKDAAMNALRAAYPDASVRSYDWYTDYYRIVATKSVYDEDYDYSYNTTLATSYVYRADYITPAETFTLTADLAEPEVTTAVKSTSVQLDFDARDTTNATGYEVYRMVGKKYQKIATVTAKTFTDKNLLSKTKYSYKVRAYSKNEKTGKVSYSKYTMVDCTTKGSALNLKAKVEKKKNVKLSWTKVPGAAKYEVYRQANSSKSTVTSKGDWDSYSSWELIKTLKKNKKAYVDKKTSANMSYSYIVRAVLSADKKVKGDKTQCIESAVSVNLGFGSVAPTAIYTAANGDRTLEWQKVYGAQGYIVEKKVYQIDPASTYYDDDKSGWVQVTKLGANATKYTFKAEVLPETYANGTKTNYRTNTEYRIYAYKDGGKTVSYDYSLSVDASLGVVESVTAKPVANGIQVSWTPVANASYYQVYRVPAGSVVKDKNDGTVMLNLESYGSPITEYVGAQAPVAVDVAAYNAAIDAWDNDTTGTVAKPLFTSKLDATKTYYYQNYQYAQSQFTTTSMVDYSGPIYSSYVDRMYNSATDKYDIYGVRPVEAKANVDYHRGPQAGVSYQYVVVAYQATQKTVADYQYDWNTPEDALEDFNYESQICGAVPGTTSAGVVGTKPLWKDTYLFTNGCAKIGEACYTSVKAPSAPTIKSVKAGKKSATIKLKKKVSGATAYKIYRAEKKKGKYICVGTTTKTSYKDTGLKSGKTYYYKVVAVTANEANADVDSKASKPKSVKAK